MLCLINAPVVFGDATVEQALTVKAADGLDLEGWLALPVGEIRGVALILPGSGNVKWDGDVSSPFVGVGYHRAPAKLSDQLAKVAAESGIATLRLTKRGYVEDPTQAIYAPLNLLKQDAVSALHALRDKFPEKKVTLIGFSEGALIATLVAAEVKVDALFLMGLPTRPIDEMLHYQFVGWPVNLLRERLDLDHDGKLSGDELSHLSQSELLPLLGPTLVGVPWRELDRNHDGALSLTNEVIPAYESQYQYALAIMNSPAMSAWYHSLKDLPRFEDIVHGISAPVYLYHAFNDAQVDWQATVADQRFFGGTLKPKPQLFEGVGHCFSPMEGGLGQIKTSGPFSNDLLATVREDLRAFGLLRIL